MMANISTYDILRRQTDIERNRPHPHGVFTRHLLGGLNGATPRLQRIISMKSLYECVLERYRGKKEKKRFDEKGNELSDDEVLVKKAVVTIGFIVVGIAVYKLLNGDLAFFLHNFNF